MVIRFPIIIFILLENLFNAELMTIENFLSFSNRHTKIYEETIIENGPRHLEKSSRVIMTHGVHEIDRTISRANRAYAHFLSTLEHSQKKYMAFFLSSKSNKFIEYVDSWVVIERFSSLTLLRSSTVGKIKRMLAYVFFFLCVSLPFPMLLLLFFFSSCKYILWYYFNAKQPILIPYCTRNNKQTLKTLFTIESEWKEDVKIPTKHLYQFGYIFRSLTSAVARIALLSSVYDNK